MGLFSRNKKPKETKWFINKKRGNFQLEDKYIKLKINLINTEHIMFYKDIIDIKKGKKCIKISSRSESYVISLVNNKEEIDEVYIQLLEKVSEYK